eukprot:CAMPEP_0172448274 /NCGR_PEP_ID=MMETSP1065-20121228/7321_1 /TAXON_ID=265537 /ORGANISM="Amphiprora paludosa, Strain CCMP125" /LENGTH=67 /DNA_ID=CAMNT_0013199717 /DNA_START=16 /DNA_END=215 /DNA_ORIENTATION=+
MTDEHNHTFYAWFRLQVSNIDHELRFVYVWSPSLQDFEVLFKIVEPQKMRASVVASNAKHEEPQRST